MEYEAEVYPRKEMAASLVEYRVKEEGWYVIEVLTKDGWLCLDATRCDNVYEYVSCIVQQSWAKSEVRRNTCPNGTLYVYHTYGEMANPKSENSQSDNSSLL